MKVELKFIAKMYTVGGSQVITIPKAFLTTLDKNKPYEFSIKEVEDGKETSTPDDG